MRSAVLVFLLAAAGCAAGTNDPVQVRSTSPTTVEVLTVTPQASTTGEVVVRTTTTTSPPPSPAAAVEPTTTTTTAAAPPVSDDEACSHRDQAGVCIEWYGASGPDPGTGEHDRACPGSEPEDEYCYR